MSLTRDDRAQLEDILARNKLGDVLADMATIYRAGTREFEAGSDEWATEWAKLGVVDDLAEEARQVILRARARVLELAGESAGLALAAVL